MGYRSRKWVITKMVSLIWSIAVLFAAITGLLSSITGGSIYGALFLAIILILIGNVVTYLLGMVLAGVDAGS